jgi:hypothetical protein
VTDGGIYKLDAKKLNLMKKVLAIQEVRAESQAQFYNVLKKSVLV